ncbi:DUF1993 domain-containing protein [Variovorax sp. J22R133]|uniref:DUF1993 domain-containing protein n=1 Tax=Variovorax brevis TaxID=3053503 RepID=UPI0025773882|nr:DUF1993 domain-containing protein [Variovorax sp. J22R133]MDM0112579.1 DUF1993 domain-containing protein [Variovorax sp. J22R133]
MALSMYEVSVPVFTRGLGQLAHVLSKGVAHAKANDVDLATLLAARLAPDMIPLTGQVQIASDAVKGAMARLAGIETPSFPDTETTFDELLARIEKTRDFALSVDRSKIDGSEQREIKMKVRGNELTFTGQQYLLHFALPNFFFHVTTAYDILRNNGVPVGKLDYLGRY